MFTFKGYKLSAAAAAVAVAAALAGTAMAQSAAHSHDAATPQKLSLDQGRKWSTDPALRNGMSRIRGLIEPRLDHAHGGKLGAAQYRDLAAKIEVEVGAIVANCKLEPKADAMLHLVIADLLAGADTMAGKNAKQSPQQGLTVVAVAINAYGSHFDHPGFKPLHDVH